MTDQRPESAIRPLELSLPRTRARIARANSRAISFLIGLPHVPPGAQPVVAFDIDARARDLFAVAHAMW
jgi:hypothetical protein